MTDIVADISSIIPRMIFGVILIIAWAPVIFLSERNNKGNNDEYKLLLDKIKSDAKFTDITSQITYPTLTNSQTNNIDYYLIKPEYYINNNMYIISYKNTKTIDSNGKETIKKEFSNELIYPPLVNGTKMNIDNYKYLARNNILKTDISTNPTNSNITYDIEIYTIPLNSNILKVEGLKQFEKELDVIIYDYEFGPEANAIEAIKNRKTGSNIFQLWLGRIGTFLMLFGGLMLLIAPFQTIVNMGEALPGPLKILAIPGRIVLNIYSTLSFFGAFILTLLMTLFMWTIVNYPLVSVLIGGLLVGLTMFFGKK